MIALALISALALLVFLRWWYPLQPPRLEWYSLTGFSLVWTYSPETTGRLIFLSAEEEGWVCPHCEAEPELWG